MTFLKESTNGQNVLEKRQYTIKDVEKGEPWYIADGDVDYYSTMEKSPETSRELRV